MRFLSNALRLCFLLLAYSLASSSIFEIQVNYRDLSDLPFEHAYPKHLRVKRVLSKDGIVIDGKLNEDEWKSAVWDSQFVDITNHSSNPSLNDVAQEFQTEVAILWDKDYIYIGARLKEPFIYGKIEGHNIQAPYHDNDFEVFIDVSGTTEYYKEFEMNVLNATYDVNWGVPDNAGLSCDDTEKREKAYLPVCVNTTFSGYDGNWTMKCDDEIFLNQGLKTASNFDQNNFAKYVDGNQWTLEIAFPMKRSSCHGGLLDTFGDDSSYEKYHPMNWSNNSMMPLYWWIDFARAEHPRQYTISSCNLNECSRRMKFCPLNCEASLNSYFPTLENPNSLQCEFLQERFPTLLGKDPTYGCYFEWVYQSLGWRNNYMHRPLEWAIVEFSDADGDCRNIEFIGRHAVKLIFSSETEYKHQEGTYSSEISSLIDERYCLEKQDCEDLSTILERSDVFIDVSIKVIENIPVFTKSCTARPCFEARVQVSVPISNYDGERHVYKTTINENMRVTVEHARPLPNSSRYSDKKICF